MSCTFCMCGFVKFIPSFFGVKIPKHVHLVHLCGDVSNTLFFGLNVIFCKGNSLNLLNFVETAQNYFIFNVTYPLGVHQNYILGDLKKNFFFFKEKIVSSKPILPKYQVTNIFFLCCAPHWGCTKFVIFWGVTEDIVSRNLTLCTFQITTPFVLLCCTPPGGAPNTKFLGLQSIL